MKKDSLVKEYNSLKRKYGWQTDIETTKITAVIREAISKFMGRHKRVAIYCNGYHTRMLMSDFMFELKDVQFIIDNYTKSDAGSGFLIISEEDLKINNIDGVIISSFDYMDSIVSEMIKRYPQIEYLNIYSKLEESGISLNCAYYETAHPYSHYKKINSLQNMIVKYENEHDQLYFELIGEYVSIKDFRTAREKAIEWGNHNDLVNDLGQLYKKELYAAKQINKDHVLILCIDGLRRADVSEVYMPKLYSCLQKRSVFFSNSYSYSTSTYESLVPVYSQNTDMRTGYFNHSSISSDTCSFIKEARNQERDIYFYTDMAEYIENDSIHRKTQFQTATEKMWDFLVDSIQCDKGLFYIHILYESHYSFANPYTQGYMLSEGTAMLFDFLEQKGGNLRTDYISQHRDALCYLDDVVTPILEQLDCQFVLFADHGNILLDKNIELKNVNPQYLTCHEEWIRIPFAVMFADEAKGNRCELFSLIDLNDVVISLMQRKRYEPHTHEWIKIGRSEIYNPDFRRLYKIMGQEKRLLAFEGFIFESGEKLVIYADGTIELYQTEDDHQVEDDEKIQNLFQVIKKEVTVC